MVGIRRLVPVGFFMLFTGVLLAADLQVVGTVENYNKKFNSISVKVPKKAKDKFDYQTYTVTDKTKILDEKGNDLKPADLEKRHDKDVTLTIKQVAPKVGTVLEKHLTVINFGKDAPKAEDKKTAVAGKDRKVEAKKEEGKAMAKAAESGKGQEAKIVSMDSGKGEIVVEISGAKHTLKVEKETRFTGPRGGDRGEGPKVLEEESKEGEVLHMPAGKVIRVIYVTVKDKSRLKEIVLPLNVKE